MNQFALDLQPQEPSYRLIPLTKGQFAKVDAADYEWLMQWKWQAAWSRKTQSYYAQRTIHIGGKSKTVIMTRVIMSAEGDIDIDHRNHDTLDNRRTNLRFSTAAQNACNRKRQANNTSGCKGVTWVPSHGKWRVRVRFKNIRTHIGYFNEFEEATLAYTEAARRIQGEFMYDPNLPTVDNMGAPRM